MARPDTLQLKTQIDTAKSITLLLPQNPSLDTVASALGLKISLEAGGKSVSVFCPTEIMVEFNRLVGIDTVTNVFGNRNLVITFPGQTEQVDKVSYNLEKGELQLVISPKQDAPDLDYRRLKFITGTKKSDLAILVGVNKLSDMGIFYQSNKDFFTTNQLVSITTFAPQENYTNLQLFDPQSSGLSELTTYILDSISQPVSLDAATNLLYGLEHATDHFSSNTVSPATFETAARLLRAGAVRQRPLSAIDFPAGSIPITPSTQLGYGTDSQIPTEISSEIKTKDPDPNWYEPKIYQGSMLP